MFLNHCAPGFVFEAERNRETASLLPLANDPLTFFNADTAAACSGASFSAFLHGAHAAFSLRASAEAERADLHTDTGRHRPFFDNPAPLCGGILDDVVVRKARRNDESCHSGTEENCAHGRSPSIRKLNLLNALLVPSKRWDQAGLISTPSEPPGIAQS
jgi:hypothetical protein